MCGGVGCEARMADGGEGVLEFRKGVSVCNRGSGPGADIARALEGEGTIISETVCKEGEARRVMSMDRSIA